MARVLLGVRGMDTPQAAATVKEALLALEGVERVEAGADRQASVEYDASSLTVMDLIRALRKRGFLAGME
jgi:copper chaperone CopZ